MNDRNHAGPITEDPMTEEEIVQFQAIIREVGERKRKGFIYICAMTGARDEDGEEVEGMTFSNGVTAKTMVINLIEILREKI